MVMVQHEDQYWYMLFLVSVVTEHYTIYSKEVILFCYNLSRDQVIACQPQETISCHYMVSTYRNTRKNNQTGMSTHPGELRPK